MDIVMDILITSRHPMSCQGYVPLCVAFRCAKGMCPNWMCPKRAHRRALKYKISTRISQNVQLYYDQAITYSFDITITRWRCNSRRYLIRTLYSYAFVTYLVTLLFAFYKAFRSYYIYQVHLLAWCQLFYYILYYNDLYKLKIGPERYDRLCQIRRNCIKQSLEINLTFSILHYSITVASDGPDRYHVRSGDRKSTVFIYSSQDDSDTTTITRLVLYLHLVEFLCSTKVWLAETKKISKNWKKTKKPI